VNKVKSKLRKDHSQYAFDSELIPVAVISTAGKPPGTTESDKAV
jgi:hypothetical protein